MIIMKNKFSTYNVDNKTPIGKCIYCESTENLTDEHAMPFAMQGDLVLFKASCKDCTMFTSKFERQIARELFGSIRTVFGFKTRHPKKRAEHYKVLLEKDGKLEPLKLPIEESPIHIFLPIFGMPLRMGAGLPGGDGFLGWNFYLLRGDRKYFNELQKKYDGDSIAVSKPGEKHAIAFARFLAKVAYCHAINAFGLDAIGETFVLPAIRGKSHDILQNVGIIDCRIFDRFDELVNPRIVMRVAVKFTESIITAQLKVW